MRWRCPLCGSETDATPLPPEQAAATCPLCGNVLPAVVPEEAPDEGLEWIEKEDPAFFDRLTKKRNRRAARRRIVRRVAIVVGVVFVALVVYVLVS